MKENRKLWESKEILLFGRTMGDEGYEVGFEEVFLYGDLAIVHGTYDVIALDWHEGKDMGERGKEPKWHFRVPMGFEILSVDLVGDVLALCGRGSTIALSAKTGEIVWEAPEMGEFYAGPYVQDQVIFTVRNSPSEVSFRHAGSGRLLNRLRLPGLTTNRKHPVYGIDTSGQNPAAAEAAETYPVAFGEGTLVVSDGRKFHAVDAIKRQMKWSVGATKLDPTMDPMYRFWIDSGRLFVLKPFYQVLENVVYDLATGDLLWRRKEGGKKADEKMKKYEGQVEDEGGKAATGLVLTSMTFVDGKVYGIRYEMGASTITLVGMDPSSGNELMKLEQPGYQDPETCVERSWSRGCITVRVQDGNKFEVWQVDAKGGKLLRKLELQGYGRLGEYGDVSAVWQGPYQALWAFDKRKFTSAK